MLDFPPAKISEAEGLLFMVNLLGAGAAVPVRNKGSNNYSVSRSAAGKLLLTFNDDPGPTFLGLAGFGFQDATPSNGAGWTAVAGAYTPATGTGGLATLVVWLFNASQTPADIAATTSVTLTLGFKQASSGL